MEKEVDLGSGEREMETKDVIEEPKNTAKESKKTTEESKEVNAEKENDDEMSIQEVSDQELDELLKEVHGGPHFEGFFPFMDSEESFVAFLSEMRDYSMDIRNRKLLGDNKVLTFARQQPPRGRSGRYVVDMESGLVATLVVHGEPRRRVFDRRDHPWTPTGVKSGVAVIGFTQKPTVKAFLLLQERRFHEMPDMGFLWTGYTIFYEEKKVEDALEIAPVPIAEESHIGDNKK